MHTCNQQNKKGGGIATITSSRFKINQLNTTNFNSFEHAEWQVQLGPTNMTILAIYHPPASTQHKTSNSDFIDQLTYLLTTIGSKNTNIVLLGDLNLHIDNPEDRDADQLIATLEAFGLEQHIKFPTHQLSHTLDLISYSTSNQTHMYTNSRALPFRPQNGNHRNQQQETNRSTAIQRIQETNYSSNNRVPKNFNNQPILDTTNLEDAIHQLNDQMLRNLNKVARMKRRRSRKKAPKSWFNKDLLDQRKIVKNREHKWLKYRQQHQWTAFKRDRNRYNQMIKFYKRHSIFTKIKDNHNNPRQLYKIISSLIGQDNTNPLPDAHLTKS